MIDPTTGMDDGQGTPAMPAMSAQPAPDAAALAQRQALAAQLAKMGAASGQNAMGGHMVGQQFVPPSAGAQASGALAQFAPALMAFMKRPVAASQPSMPGIPPMGAAPSLPPGMTGGD